MWDSDQIETVCGKPYRGTIQSMGICCSNEGVRQTDYEEGKPIPRPASIPYHAQPQTHHYVVRYPDHPPRTESALYRKTHKELCDGPTAVCFLCGTKGPGLETHHWIIEKAAQEAIDWTLFGVAAEHLFHIQTGVCIGDAFDWSAVAANPDLFVDSPLNMLVLCREHHTSATHGIHHIPFPVWMLQGRGRNGFVFVE